MARPILPLNITCNTPAVSMNAKAPDGFPSYRWSTGETTQTITIKGSGTYQAIMKDNWGNTSISAPLVIAESVQPPVPVINPSGEQVICADSSLLLNVNVSSINTVKWSTGVTGKSIIAKQAGTYTASLTNIYGCVSGVSSPVTIKTLSIKAPALTQSGPYSLQATPDSTIYTFADSKVSKITWEWVQGGRSLTFNESAIKVTEIGSFSTRSGVTFVSTSGGNFRTCVSPYSQVVTYRPAEKEDGLIVYPNPNRSGKVAIETLSDLTNVQIIISSLTGQVVYDEKFATLNIRKVIELTHLSEGEYILKLSSSTFRDSQRIIIDY